MKSMIIFVSCVLAVASAGYSAYGPSSYAFQGNGAYNGPVNHGGYSHAGAPLPVQDTYEVAAAKAAHFQAHAIARGQAHAAPLAHGHSYTSSVAHGYAHAAPVAHAGYYGAEARVVDPVAVAAGAPLPVQDTHEVAAAKAAHFQAHAAARGQAHGSPLAHGYSHVTPVAHGYGYAHAAPIAHGYAHSGQYGSEARLVDPVAIAAGAPLPGGDTYEVAAAKAAHLHAHAAAKNGHLGLY